MPSTIPVSGFAGAFLSAMLIRIQLSLVGAVNIWMLGKTGVAQTTEPGTMFLDRVNQVDVAVSRDFRFGRARVRPQFDFFNAFNSNAVTQVNTSFGPSLLQPQSILNPRLIRFNVRVSY